MGKISINNWGTFDVANYGDPLFPLILERELKRRLGRVDIALSSPGGGQFLPNPSRQVDRILRFNETDFTERVSTFDAIVVGGGDIIRFDGQFLADILYPLVSTGFFNSIAPHHLI